MPLIDIQDERSMILCALYFDNLFNRTPGIPIVIPMNIAGKLQGVNFLMSYIDLYIIGPLVKRINACIDCS